MVKADLTLPTDMKLTDNKPLPWVSFCIATYKRTEILAETLRSIQKQEFQNFEVVVSDNDPEQTSRSVVENFGDNRFKYYYNKINVGMVKNFNLALSHATGEYVVMLADDDPPYGNFLSELHTMWMDFPNYGAYYGACEVLMEDHAAAVAYGTKTGKIECLAPVSKDAVRCFSKEEFPVKYFQGEVFPYILWSTGVVSRQIVLKIGGMPDYGSPLLTDISYIAMVGSDSGCVTINKILGRQTVHGTNSGLINPHNVSTALKGSYQYLSKGFSHREDWPTVCDAMEKYLIDYIVTHASAMDRFFVASANKLEQRKLKETINEITKLPFMQAATRRLNWPRTYRIIELIRHFILRVISIAVIRRVISPLKKALLG